MTPAQRAQLDQFAADCRKLTGDIIYQARTNLGNGADPDLVAYTLAVTVRDAIESGAASVDQAAMELAWLVAQEARKQTHNLTREDTADA
jgi:hypothetical protein